MKKKNREITVFSLSALDLFCSAMGVFMILCFILFPYFGRKAPEPLPVEPEKPVEPQEPEQPKEPEEPEKPVEPVVIEKLIPSLTIAMHWEMLLHDPRGKTKDSWQTIATDDVDLRVDAPSATTPGKILRYGRNERMHPDSPAVFLIDSMIGGGEVWMHPNVTSGAYKVYYSVAAKTSSRKITVNYKYGGGTEQFVVKAYRIVLTVVTPNGVFNHESGGANRIEPVVIPFERFVPNLDKYDLITTINVGEDGSITIN